MTTPTAPTPPAAAPPTDRRAELVQQAVAAKVLGELVKTADATIRDHLLNLLLEEYRASGLTRFDAKAFGLAGIGHLTLPENKTKVTVGDKDAFEDWADTYDQLQTVVIVNPDWQKAYLDSLVPTKDEESGEWFALDPLRGEPVPGVVVAPGGEPTKFNVNLAKTSMPQVTAAVLQQTVAALTQATLLAAGEAPAIESGAQA